MVFVPWKANVGIFGWRCDSTPCAVLSKRVTFAHSQTRHGSSDGTSSRHFELLATLHRFSVRLSLFSFSRHMKDRRGKYGKYFMYTHIFLSTRAAERGSGSWRWIFHSILRHFLFANSCCFSSSFHWTSSRSLSEYTMFNFPNLWGWWEKKNCWKNFEWCEKSWQLKNSSSPHFIPSFARSFFFFRSSLFCHLLHIFIWCRTSRTILTALTRFFLLHLVFMHIEGY